MQHLGGTSAKYSDIPFLMDERELEIGACEGKGGGGGVEWNSESEGKNLNKLNI
jgi:hypothetical protein